MRLHDMHGSLKETAPTLPQPVSVCVAIVNYNSGPLLAQCVQSVLRSSLPVQVYVSDNGSTDDSIARLREAVGSHSSLTIIENHQNLGFARGSNAVVPHCSSDYLLFLNPDCIIWPDTIEKMLAAMQAHPDAGMAGCLIRNPDGSEQAGCRRFVPTPWRALVRVLKLSKLVRNHPRFSSFLLTGQPLPEYPTPVEAISGAFMFVRRSAMDFVGLMDEGYFLHCEDLDWCMRFRQAGLTILFVPHAEIVHIKGGSGGHPIPVEWHKHKGMIRFYRKFFRRRYPAPLLYMVIMAVWARFALVVAKLAVMHVLRTDASKRLPLPQDTFTPGTTQTKVRGPSVIVTGATSQIGYFLIPRLRRAGYLVHAISRRRAHTPSAIDHSLVWHEIDIARDADSLKNVPATLLIHLAPLVTLPPLIEPAAQAGIRRIVAFSSTSRYSKITSANPYEQRWVAELIHSEAELERQCTARGITWTVFRPTLIYGCGMDKNISTIASFVRRFGFFPIVGKGNGLRRPVHADDLAAACITAVDCPATFNRAYNLSGGETLTYRQMVERIFQGLGMKPRVIRLPAWLFTQFLKVGALLPRYRHLNTEMVGRINSDLDFDHLAATHDFGYSPRDFQFSPDTRDFAANDHIAERN